MTNTSRTWQNLEIAPGNEQVRLRRACVRPVEGIPADPITVRTPFVFEFEYWNLKPCADFYLGIELFDSKQTLLFGSGAPRSRRDPGLYREACSIPGDLLNNGSYHIVVFMGKGSGKELHREDNVLAFDIQDQRDPETGWFGTWKGAIRPMLDWATTPLAEKTDGARI